jgi:isopenicillin-N N-acyltransferase like protein
MSSSTPAYPLYCASGSFYELGRAHGEQAGEKIDGYLDFLGRQLKLSRDELRARAAKYLPLFERDCPHLLDEIRGLAEGAGLPFEDALAAQLRGELKPIGDGGTSTDGGCTTFVISGRGTANGQTLIGQTSDNPAELEDFGYILNLKPNDQPDMLMWTFGGMIGYHGINRHGVCHFVNSLGGGPGWKFALSHYPLKRLILEQRTVADVVQLMRDVPVCSNGNYVLCDGEGTILDVELNSDGPELIAEDEAGFLAHSNHYLCGPYACEENFDQSLKDSFPRLERMRQLIGEKFGSITLDDMKSFLADHDNFPIGICRHPHDGEDYEILPSSGKTVAALIAEPSAGKLHVTLGNACENPFVEYSLDSK